MSKDPAVLFYTADFLVGVADMPFLERGYYITLLCMQHQKGHLSAETICFSLGLRSVNEISKVMQHFVQDEDGFYFQKRMELETEKRCNYTKSRRENGEKGGRPKQNHMDNHMGTHMGNENDNRNIDSNLDNKGVKGEKKKAKFAPPSVEEIREYCQSRDNSIDAKKFWDYFDAGGWNDAKGNPVKNWKQKIITWEGKQSGPASGDKKPNPKYANLKTIDL